MNFELANLMAYLIARAGLEERCTTFTSMMASDDCPSLSDSQTCAEFGSS